MTEQHTPRSWLWPDHVIGKRESRTLREEHNRMVNVNIELREALEYYTSPQTQEWITGVLDRETCSDLCDKTYEFQGCPSGTCAKREGDASWREAYHKARAALAKAKGE